MRGCFLPCSASTGWATSLFTSCSCQLQTAVGAYSLPGLYRMRAAQHVLQTLEARISEVQGALPEDWTVDESAEVPANVVEDTPSTSATRAATIVAVAGLPHALYRRALLLVRSYAKCVPGLSHPERIHHANRSRAPHRRDRIHASGQAPSSPAHPLYDRGVRRGVHELRERSRDRDGGSIPGGSPATAVAGW